MQQIVTIHNLNNSIRFACKTISYNNKDERKYLYFASKSEREKKMGKKFHLLVETVKYHPDIQCNIICEYIECESILVKAFRVEYF